MNSDEAQLEVEAVERTVRDYLEAVRDGSDRSSFFPPKAAAFSRITRQAGGVSVPEPAQLDIYEISVEIDREYATVSLSARLIGADIYLDHGRIPFELNFEGPVQLLKAHGSWRILTGVVNSRPAAQSSFLLPALSKQIENIKIEVQAVSLREGGTEAYFRLVNERPYALASGPAALRTRLGQWAMGWSAVPAEIASGSDILTYAYWPMKMSLRTRKLRFRLNFESVESGAIIFFDFSVRLKGHSLYDLEVRPLLEDRSDRE